MNQLAILTKAFRTPKTMLQVAKETKIERASICRRIAELREIDRIEVVKRGLCPITKHRAGFYKIIE